MKRLSSKLIVTTLVAGGLAAAVPVFAGAHGHGAGGAATPATWAVTVDRGQESSAWPGAWT
jgi:hypothetical protein